MTAKSKMIMYIARDKDGQLMIFRNKPNRDKSGTRWGSEDSKHYGSVPPFLAPGLRWEDEPIKVEMETVK